MGTLPRYSGLFVFAAIATAGVMLVGLTGWPQPHLALELSALIAVAILASVLAAQRPAAEDRGMTPLFFVIHFTCLLLVGAHVTIVAAAGAVAFVLADTQRTRPLGRTVVNVATIMVALQAAGLVHWVLGGTLGHFEWPWQAAPIAAAVFTYSIVRSASAEIIVPLLMGEPLNRAWPSRVLEDFPHHVIGAGIAVGLTEVVDHRMWEVLPVAAAPLFFAHKAYCASVRQFEDEHRSLEAIESLDQGISVIDGNGRITLWNAALEEMVDCSRERALGRSLVAVVPVLQATGLPRAIDEAIANRTPSSQLLFGALSTAGGRVLQVRIVPAADSTTLLWLDVTEQKRGEYEVRRSEERLALAAEGASDGLWEWDLRSKEFYVSARWRAMMGLPAAAAIGRPEDWMDRVHPDEIAPLKEALDAYLSGKADHFQYRAPAPPRERHVQAVPLPRCREARRRPPGDPHRRIADRHDGPLAGA